MDVRGFALYYSHVPKLSRCKPKGQRFIITVDVVVIIIIFGTTEYFMWVLPETSSKVLANAGNSALHEDLHAVLGTYLSSVHTR